MNQQTNVCHIDDINTQQKHVQNNAFLDAEFKALQAEKYIDLTRFCVMLSSEEI